jgi:hypothetical protein
LIAARNSSLEQDWWHTASLLAQYHNANREKGKPAVSPEKFNPFTKPTPVKRRPATAADLEALFGPRR